MNSYDVSIRLIKCKATGHVSIFWHYKRGFQRHRQCIGHVSTDGKILLVLPEVDLDVLFQLVEMIRNGEVDADDQENYGIKK